MELWCLAAEMKPFHDAARLHMGPRAQEMTKSDLDVDLAELAFVSACVAGVVGSDYDCLVYYLVVYITSSIGIYIYTYLVCNANYTFMYQ